MVWIPGSNNGTWGMGMARGAVFPASMGGPFGYQGFPLPNIIQHPTGVMDKPYLGRSFGRRFGTVYELTPGGVTTAASWGFKDKAFGRRRSKRSRKSKKFRCKGLKEDGKRCKHKTTDKFCKHHLKQDNSRRKNRRSKRK